MNERMNEHNGPRVDNYWGWVMGTWKFIVFFSISWNRFEMSTFNKMLSTISQLWEQFAVL